MATAEYKAVIKEKLNDPVLRRNLNNFADAYWAAREKAYAVKNFAALREEVKNSKTFARENLTRLADQFENAAIQRGAKVFRAGSGVEANEYILNLARAKGVKSIVKSKSMASEEIHLNEFLRQNNINAIETDLGEYIIQLSGERPSHMVMPAIHKSRQQVAELFSQELKKDIPVDIEYLVKTARNVLRDEYFKAEMGISGANIGVAETGSVVLVTNEGNDRLVTTIPPVHVVIMGYEKLVATMSDAYPIIEALPRSATAQKITSYVSVITGTTPAVDEANNAIEKELHIILLDNGRLDMAKDPVMGQAWQCIRCASCLNVCPVYQLVGGHVYGDIYAGGIGVILTSFVNSPEQADKLQELCISCGRCKEVCPGKVPITDLIVELRDRLTDKRSLSTTPKFIFDKILSNRKIFHTLLRMAALGQKPLTLGAPVMRHLPLYGLTEFRSLPAISTKPFRDLIKEYKQNVPDSAPTVSVFIGCATDFAYPTIGLDAVKVLNRLGYRVSFAQEQSCCATPARYMGDLKTARKLAKENIKALESSGEEPIIAVCPTCVGALAHDYINLFKGDPAWTARAKKVSERVVEFTQFLNILPESQKKLLPGYDVKAVELKKYKSVKPVKVTYHDSCHMKRNLGISEEPRELLKLTPGIDFVEMEHADRCCGCGGSFSLKFPELSGPILEKKLINVEKSGAEILAVACPGCLMQLKGGLDKKGSKVQVKHVAELLAEVLQ